MSGHSFLQRTSWCFISCTLVLLSSCSPEQNEEKESHFSDEDIQALSETMGHFLVNNLHAQHIKLDIGSLVRGIEDAEAGAPPPMSQQQFYQMMANYKKDMIKVKSAENLKIAEDFLMENRSREGMTSLKEGKVQYITLADGYGEAVAENGTPLVHYEGRLIDGTVFDSSRLRGTPLSFSLDATIPGFKAAVSGMKEGEKRRIYIHPEMGYGTQGRLPPNSLLIFDVEIVQARPDDRPAVPQELHHENEEKNSQSDAPADHETSYRWLNKIKEAVF